METKIIIIMILVAFINMVDTLAYGARLAGARTQSPALAMSLYNIVALASRTANLIQLPLVATVVDTSLKKGESSAVILNYFRLIILGNSLGVLLGILFIPLAVRAFTWGILRMETSHSVPLVMFSLLKPQNLKKAVQVPLTGVRHYKSLSLSNLPLSFIFTNPILISFYSVGVLASIYAGFLIPEYRLTASQLSGIINGIATILLVTIVDPISALLMDDTLKGKRDVGQLRSAVGFLAGGRLLGTLLAQILLVPASWLIVWITRWLI